MLSTAADMSWPHLAERERIHRAAWKLSTDFLHDDKTHKHARLLTNSLPRLGTRIEFEIRRRMARVL
jgi:hypothetical protein